MKSGIKCEKVGLSWIVSLDICHLRLLDYFHDSPTVSYHFLSILEYI